MDKERALDILAALAQESRLDAFRLLVESDPGGLPAGEIAERLGALQNTMSGNLAILARAGLVSSCREGRTIRYALDAGQVRAFLGFLLEDCCAGRPEICDAIRPPRGLPFEKQWAAGRVLNVLFLGTANSARSVMAEAIVNHDHAGRFRAFSAGSRPEGRVSPHAIALLKRLGYPTAGLRPKGREEFARLGAPRMDFVFTVCDAAAQERCPTWPGAPIGAHWGIPAPTFAGAPEAAQRRAHADAFRRLERRIGAFASLPFPSLERLALKRRLDQIGATDDLPQRQG